MSFKILRKKWLIFCVVAVLATLASRISIAYFLANDEPDDGKGYALLANNLLEHHIFSLDDKEPYEPTLIRMPGYPLFLAAIYSVFGHGNNTAVRIIQAFVDTATCVLVALIAWNWVTDEKRKRKALVAAFALAALCPFVVIYTATIMTETLTTFFAVAMTLATTYAFKARSRKLKIIWWIVAGLLAGACVLLRPDSGLFAAGLGLTLVIAGLFIRDEPKDVTKRSFLPRLARTSLHGALFSVAFILVLLPWTIRNERVFHLFQPLSPAHGEMPGEFVPQGYNMWLRTWIDDQRYIGPMLWDMDTRPINMDEIPASAFDSEEERARVAALFDRYNHPPDEEQANSANNDQAQNAQADSAKSGNGESANDNSSDEEDNASDEDKGDEDQSADESDQSQDETDQTQEKQDVEMTPEIDVGFAQIARERIARSPMRYYLWLPAKRAASLWFDTHSMYYPFSGELFPLKDLDHDTHQQVWLPIFAALVWLYTLLGLAGALFLLFTRDGASRRWLVLVALMVLPRIVFFSTVENPEPRYVVELFAFTSLLGGIALARMRRIKN
ncbi:MAG TPA: glycosyltransferase family 39 protein [Pyrinomonadaceae bacterium]|nr:glycosyltransferase family 39 protein [Pyrinomonadaceae bacterium]